MLCPAVPSFIASQAITRQQPHQTSRRPVGPVGPVLPVFETVKYGEIESNSWVSKIPVKSILGYQNFTAPQDRRPWRPCYTVCVPAWRLDMAGSYMCAHHPGFNRATWGKPWARSRWDSKIHALGV